MYCFWLEKLLHFYCNPINRNRNYMKKPDKKNILVSVPVPLLKKLDTHAKRQSRSRTSMVCILLEGVLNAPKQSKPEQIGA